jgi:hypothetical protein
MFFIDRARTLAGTTHSLVETSVRALPLAILVLPACAPAHADGARPSSAAQAPPSEGTALASGASTKVPSDASRLAWMEGHWLSAQGGVEMEELWTSPSGGALIGMHKDVKGAHMTSFEFLRVDSTPEGGLAYFASPRSAPVTSFALIELGEKRAVFENRAHDFPQRILYWMAAPGELHARIEGTMKGSLASEEWTFTKR